MIVYPEDLAKLAVLAGVNIVVIGVAVYAWLRSGRAGRRKVFWLVSLVILLPGIAALGGDLITPATIYWSSIILAFVQLCFFLVWLLLAWRLPRPVHVAEG